jgi:effector-binding domain-containing protein
VLRIGYEFGGQGTAEGKFLIVPERGRTRITWRLRTELGWNPARRVSGLAFDRAIGPFLEQGLANLKALAESLPGADWSQVQISVEELAPMVIAVTDGRSGPGPAAAAAALATAYGRVSEFLIRSRIAPAGAPVAITREWDPEDGWEFFAGIPIAEPPAVRPDREAPVRIGRTPEGRTVVALHVGPYSGLEATYDAVAAYMAVHALEAAGPRWEQYVSDPGTTPAAELVTRVCVPVR